ncbi:hypothetical protein BCR44DRAFT_1434364, partial [Catenaria anguillulae PL171]
ILVSFLCAASMMAEVSSTGMKRPRASQRSRIATLSQQLTTSEHLSSAITMPDLLIHQSVTVFHWSPPDASAQRSMSTISNLSCTWLSLNHHSRTAS